MTRGGESSGAGPLRGIGLSDLFLILFVCIGWFETTVT
jgi:hypothetical protein